MLYYAHHPPPPRSVFISPTCLDASLIGPSEAVVFEICFLKFNRAHESLSRSMLESFPRCPVLHLMSPQPRAPSYSNPGVCSMASAVLWKCVHLCRPMLEASQKLPRIVEGGKMFGKCICSCRMCLATYSNQNTTYCLFLHNYGHALDAVTLAETRTDA